MALNPVALVLLRDSAAFMQMPGAQGPKKRRRPTGAERLALYGQTSNWDMQKGRIGHMPSAEELMAGIGQRVRPVDALDERGFLEAAREGAAAEAAREEQLDREADEASGSEAEGLEDELVAGAEPGRRGGGAGSAAGAGDEANTLSATNAAMRSVAMRGRLPLLLAQTRSGTLGVPNFFRSSQRRMDSAAAQLLEHVGAGDHALAGAVPRQEPFRPPSFLPPPPSHCTLAP